MDVTFAVLADYANVSREGKLNVMGIFDRVFARQLPSRFPPMQLVIRLEAQPAELDREHAIRIQLSDPEGAALFDINGSFTPRGPDPGQPVSVNHVVGLADLPLQKTGVHTIAIWVDGDRKRQVALRVDEPPGVRGSPPEAGGEPTFH
jgi:hypothetical protein